jgi:hypothetical protein
MAGDRNSGDGGLPGRLGKIGPHDPELLPVSTGWERGVLSMMPMMEAGEPGTVSKFSPVVPL